MPRVTRLFQLTALTWLAACSAIGEKDFACPGRPPGVRCMSATQVYQATHESDFVAPTAPEALGDLPDGTQQASAQRVKHRRSSSQTPRGVVARTRQRTTADREVDTPAAERPVPVRHPAQVMRVWIAPWEDARGVLHGGEHAFIEIQARRWSIGEPATNEPVRFFSIQTPETESKKTVGKDSAVPLARPGTSNRSAPPTLPKAGVPK